MDMVMPVMTGVAATEYIMAYMPTPILIVSASTNRGELFKTYDALAAGAVDVLEKPPADDHDGAWERRFVAAVKLIARIKVITHVRARLTGAERGVMPTSDAATTTTQLTRLSETCRHSVLVLGASTGGPAAIVKVLQSLPRGINIPVLFVLHIDEPFGVAFAEWLSQQTSHRVVYAREAVGLDSLSGQVIMAPPGRHLVVQGGRLHLHNDPPRHSCRPSIDVLFESVAADRGVSTLACLLTGMGRDGAAGLLAIRRAGGFTIAQDESTSIVYGMPREAVILGAAQKVLPRDQI
jgi:two-component system chemotaxis response regulator CheB